ncbi:MAG TPA: fatty acid desaturase [Silvibacterium sp.]|nr:fatty acid desaturase [Silvibacterium sp.]
MSTLVESAPSAEVLSTETLEADSRFLTQSRSAHFNWLFGFWIAVFHIGAIAALFFFSRSALAAAAVLWVIGQNVGIGMSYHRLLTHRGYTTPRWVEYALAICGTLALQGGPLYWVAVHRLHHQLTDRPGDPHSPRDGKWWSHMGWILQGTLRNRTTLLNRYAPDLARNSFYVWLSRYHWVPATVVGFGLYFLGGWPWVLWGIFLRVTLGLHVTWLVNSATHMWGSRRFETRDDSRNNWWVALLTGGEGWHNNHHAHPVSASHGMAWYEVDINYWGIRLLGFLGFAKRIKVLGPKAGPARVLHG